MKEHPIAVQLSRQDWGQVVDGLHVRAETWRKTEQYLKGEEVDGEIEECHNPAEAKHLAETYERILAVIENALSAEA